MTASIVQLTPEPERDNFAYTLACAGPLAAMHSVAQSVSSAIHTGLAKDHPISRQVYLETGLSEIAQLRRILDEVEDAVTLALGGARR